MPYLNWSDKYSIGIAEMDRQHIKLLDLINGLYDAMKAGEGQQKSMKILEDLANYTELHFADEEKVMLNSNYPGYAEHKEKHRKITAKVRDYQRQCVSGSITIAFQLLQFLKDWLVKHILDTDMEYARHINS